MTDDVARYYDANTRDFLARGQGGSSGVIHRAVWGPGVTTREEAFHFVHELILREMEACRAKRILDLGCGVGASLAYITAKSGARGTGITNSNVQASLAADDLDIVIGSFEKAALPEDVDLAYAIESFVHTEDPGGFFENVAQSIRPGGRLVICDDFATGERDGPWVRAFREGWHAPSVMTPEALDGLAREHGFSFLSDRDLTPHLEIDRPRDYAIRIIAILGRLFGVRGPRLDALLGGDALRRCLKLGSMSYRMRTYERAVMRGLI